MPLRLTESAGGTATNSSSGAKASGGQIIFLSVEEKSPSPRSRIFTRSLRQPPRRARAP